MASGTAIPSSSEARKRRASRPPNNLSSLPKTPEREPRSVSAELAGAEIVSNYLRRRIHQRLARLRVANTNHVHTKEHAADNGRRCQPLQVRARCDCMD